MPRIDGRITADALRTADGGFAMLALDQRESLRNLFGQAGQSADDRTLITFKHAAARLLSADASAVLLDLPLGLRDGIPMISPGCSLILGADIFVQPPGSIVLASDLDPDVTVDRIHACGAAALKLLVLWRADSGREERADLVGRFLSLCDRADVASVLEGVVRPPEGADWASGSERDDAILSAATEFSASRPSLYKAEVPGLGRLPAEELVRRAAQITSVLSSPWVVLSSGVRPNDFPDAVEAACRGGADGFLAGRAIWADSIGAPDVTAHLRETARARIRRLREAVRSGRADRGVAGLAAGVHEVTA